MLLPETDSLIYIIETKNVYEDFYKYKNVTSLIIQTTENIKLVQMTTQL